MTISTTAPLPITASLVSEEKRTGFLPAWFICPIKVKVSNGIISGENCVYSYMDKFCEDYSGGYWNFYTLSNQGFYMAPNGDERIQLVNSMNYSDETVSCDAAGIICSLFSLNALGGILQIEKAANAYHQLLDYVDYHKEANAIYRLID